MLDKVKEKLLTPAGLEISDVQKSLDRLYSSDLDFGDIYFENMVSEGWGIDESVVKSGSYSIYQGFGVRAVSGEKTALAHSDEISATAIDQSVRSARSITRHGQERTVNLGSPVAGHSLYSMDNPIDSVDRDRKIRLLQDMDEYARSKSPLVKQFNASIAASYCHSMVMATDGTVSADIKPSATLRCSVVVEKDGRKEIGRSGGGLRGGFEFFFNDVGDRIRAMSYVDEAFRQAMVNLEAEAAPAGPMTVVLAAGWAGVLIHEAVGHGLEGDSCRKGESLFSKLMGQQVASPVCTVVDDGRLPDSVGSLNVDDEGVPTRYNVLIDKGNVASFMYDRHNARLAGVSSTGNGRRMGYSNAPIPRMTNTYMLPGESDPQEIVSSVDSGIYAVDFAGGQVDPTSGQFVFKCCEAYLLENGKVTRPIKGATLIGNAIEVMKSISMVGNDLKFDPGLGTCGKAGQWVRVGIGIPTLKLDRITVGGTSQR